MGLFELEVLHSPSPQRFDILIEGYNNTLKHLANDTEF